MEIFHNDHGANKSKNSCHETPPLNLETAKTPKPRTLKIPFPPFSKKDAEPPGDTTEDPIQRRASHVAGSTRRHDGEGLSWFRGSVGFVGGRRVSVLRLMLAYGLEFRAFGVGGLGLGVWAQAVHYCTSTLVDVYIHLHKYIHIYIYGAKNIYPYLFIYIYMHLHILFPEEACEILRPRPCCEHSKAMPRSPCRKRGPKGRITSVVQTSEAFRV